MIKFNTKLLAYSFVATLAFEANATQFSIPGAGASFEAPDGFTELSAKEISSKYLSGRPPTFVVGDEQRLTTIAYDLKPTPLPPDTLKEVKATFETLFERMIPGIEWKKKAIVSMQGQEWILLEMTSHAIDTDIYNIMLITPRNGKMLLFNFNSTKAEFPKLELALRKSIQSILLK